MSKCLVCSHEHQDNCGCCDESDYYKDESNNRRNIKK